MPYGFSNLRVLFFLHNSFILISGECNLYNFWKVSFVFNVLLRNSFLYDCKKKKRRIRRNKQYQSLVYDMNRLKVPRRKRIQNKQTFFSFSLLLRRFAFFFFCFVYVVSIRNVTTMTAFIEVCFFFPLILGCALLLFLSLSITKKQKVTEKKTVESIVLFIV